MSVDEAGPNLVSQGSSPFAISSTSHRVDGGAASTPAYRLVSRLPSSA
jgi:hypothetical protein